MEKIPKVFISYSWTTPQHEEKVLALAARLMSHGVDVVLDKWDLKEGQDKYVFMEQAVTNPDIDRVLLICDRVYAEKADKRAGGVGDETTIISAELYGKASQEKFIPVIFEVDEDGKPYCPAYAKSRIYIDLSTEDDRYESEYEKLLRNIHQKPIYKKPALGSRPEWIENESVDLSPIRDLIRQIKGYTGNNKAKEESLLRRFMDVYLIGLKSYVIKERPITGEKVVNKIAELKPIRDLYIDFLETLIMTDLSIADVVTNFLENTYNSILDATETGNSCSQYDFEYYQFFIWEVFICTIAYLFHYEKFREIHDILCHTYFLRDSFFEGANITSKNFTQFRHYFQSIENDYKPKSKEPNLFTYTGKLLVEREKKPVITRETLTNADVMLCQLSYIFDCKRDNGFYWFPTSYIYGTSLYTQWIKLKSKKYCLKILPLFGVKSIDDLKEIIRNHPIERDMRYNGSFESAPGILSSIRLEDIGSLN